MGGGVNISRSLGEERSAVGNESFSFRGVGCRGLSARDRSLLVYNGIAGRGDIAGAISRGGAGGLRHGAPSCPPRGKAGRVVGLSCWGRSVICRGAGVCPQGHRCVPRCVPWKWQYREGLSLGLTGPAAVINRSALRRGGSAGETVLTSVELVLWCVMGLTAASFPLPAAFGCV